jgi:hypothetical protein
MNKEDVFKILELLTSEDNANRVLGIHLALSQGLSKEDIAELCIIVLHDSNDLDSVFIHYTITDYTLEVERPNHHNQYNYNIRIYDMILNNYNLRCIKEDIVGDDEFKLELINYMIKLIDKCL